MPKFEKYQQATPNYVELTTPDPEAGAAFYAGLFGWDIEEMPLPAEAGGGVYRQSKLDGDTVTGISGQMPGMEGHPAFWGVYLAVDDVDAAAAKVEPAGGKVEAGPFDVMDAGRMVAIQDPTGARVNLWQAAASIGTERANEPGTPIWNEVITPDVPKALAFYADVVGLGTEVMEMPEGEYTTIKNVAGDVVGGAMLPMMEGIPPHWNVYFNVEDADASGARAVELGGKVVAPNFDVQGVGRMGFYSDPQGGMFALMQNPPA
ncbi:VOC family protein [Nocardioides marmoriginsengisoli]|uniref:VOC family protein n=1 Tax=Nocardioides marmoriginsengisoli TaxID=661483 RepID=A0A3N0CFI8_9ACTN|nr:VOC family protein [Nocardioides marmoriginsengisoli]RNL62059.1 VOC family protein [Nocardioides marmoriginsengisoli]